MASKDPTKNVNIHSTKWKMFVNHISDKVLVSRIYRKLLQFDNKKTLQFKNEQRT